jgi:hypothetical protein
VSDPPRLLHIGRPPHPIGPSAAFPSPVTNNFSLTDTVVNPGATISSAAQVTYYL